MTYFAIKDPTIVDIECFPNFFMVAFRNLRTGRVIVCMITDRALIAQIMRAHTTLSFNGNKYDLPMIAAAIQGYTESQLKELSDQLIQSGVPHWKICRERGIEIPYEWDHVDLIEVAPGVMTSLKIYGGRMHSQRLQDLPYPHDSQLSDEQKQVVVDYCGNDLITTEELYQQLLPQIELRQSMSEQYGIDLRSKSDAQVAEGVLKREALRMSATVVKKVEIPPGTKLRYTDPGFLRFRSPELNQLLQRVLATEFELGENGAPLMPEWMKLFTVGIGSARYKLGIGGLHSQETCQLVRADKDHILSDWDVASFYPAIILQQKMFPPGVGEVFLSVYQGIVNRRLTAKRRMQQIEKEMRDIKRQLKND